MNAIATIPDWIVILIKSAILLLVVVTTFAYAMLAERKVLGWMQLRPGPQSRRTVGIIAARGRRGQAHPKGRSHAEDGRSADLSLAPFISLLTAFSVYAIIPFGASSRERGRSATSTPASSSCSR
jgi:NADH-quinone oxidoreductase subunit H